MQDKKKTDRLKVQITKLFDDILSEMKELKTKSFCFENEFKMSTLFPYDPTKELSPFGDLSDKEKEEFQYKHGIKTRNLSERKWNNWNKKYIHEAIFVRYNWVVSLSESFIKDIRVDILEKINVLPLSDILKDVEKAFVDTLALVSSDEGRLYYNEEYRRTEANFLSDRFEAIWWINERYEIFSLGKSENPKGFSSWSEYPFINIDMKQWNDFDIAYHTIPLLKDIVQILKGEYKRPLLHVGKNGIEFDRAVFLSPEGQDDFIEVLKSQGGLDAEYRFTGLKGKKICQCFYDLSKNKKILPIFRVDTYDAIMAYLIDKHEASLKLGDGRFGVYKDHEMEQIKESIKGQLNKLNG